MPRGLGNKAIDIDIDINKLNTTVTSHRVYKLKGPHVSAAAGLCEHRMGVVYYLYRREVAWYLLPRRWRDSIISSPGDINGYRDPQESSSWHRKCLVWCSHVKIDLWSTPWSPGGNKYVVTSSNNEKHRKKKGHIALKAPEIPRYHGRPLTRGKGRPTNGHNR